MTKNTSLSAFSRTNLVPITRAVIDGGEREAVDARDLHRFLDINTPFHKWIKRRINEYEFTQGIDFIESPNLSNRGFWQTEGKEYRLSLDMAKELAMVERSAKGREVRRYFIEIERQATLLAAHTEKLRIRELNLPAYTRNLEQKIADLEYLVDDLQDEWCKTHPEMLKLLGYRRMGLSLADCAKLLDCAKSTIARRVRTLRDLGFEPDAEAQLELSPPRQSALPFDGDVQGGEA